MNYHEISEVANDKKDLLGAQASWPGSGDEKIIKEEDDHHFNFRDASGQIIPPDKVMDDPKIVETTSDDGKSHSKKKRPSRKGFKKNLKRI